MPVVLGRRLRVLLGSWRSLLVVLALHVAVVLQRRRCFGNNGWLRRLHQLSRSWRLEHRRFEQSRPCSQRRRRPLGGGLAAFRCIGIGGDQE